MFKHGHEWSDNHRQFRLEPKSHDGEDGEHSGNYPLLETLHGWLTPPFTVANTICLASFVCSNC